jgi:hypothetical protein
MFGALEGDPLGERDLPQPFTAATVAAAAGGEIVGELADRPMGETAGRPGGTWVVAALTINARSVVVIWRGAGHPPTEGPTIASPDR